MTTSNLYFTQYNDAYQTCERTLVTFRIYTGVMDPSEITDMLAIQPTRTTRKGESIHAAKTGITRIKPLNAWFLSSEENVISKDLRVHLDWILNRLHPHSNAIRHLQEQEGVCMQMSCIWWSACGDGGPVIWPVQMQKLVDLNLECGFEFAFYGVDE